MEQTNWYNLVFKRVNIECNSSGTQASGCPQWFRVTKRNHAGFHKSEQHVGFSTCVNICQVLCIWRLVWPTNYFNCKQTCKRFARVTSLGRSQNEHLNYRSNHILILWIRSFYWICSSSLFLIVCICFAMRAWLRKKDGLLGLRCTW